jgi:hypothetical protein
VDGEDGGRRDRLVRLRAEVGALHRQAVQASTTRHWDEGRRRLREAVLADDPEQLLSWPVIRDTMLVAGDRHPYLAAELATLQDDAGWEQRWHPACLDEIGVPPPLPGLPGGSGNRLHHAYQFLQLEQAGAGGVQDYRHLVEFGAGYGAMCAVAHRLGFSGSYLLFDLPEWSALQRWYLGEVGLLADGGPVRTSSDEDVLREEVARADEGSLLVAMWSLSETPLELRQRILPGGERFGGYLFGYQATFEGIDNLAWFAQFQRDRPDVEWTGGEPEAASGNRYLVGRRR